VSQLSNLGRSSKRFWRIFERPVLVLVSFGIGCVLVEGGVRVSRHIAPSLCQSFDRTSLDQSYTYSMRSAAYPANATVRHCAEDFDVTYEIDDFGYRGRLGSPDRRSILTIGDSFAFGYGVRNSETFAARLGSYNGGLWGTSFPYHVRALEYLLPRTAPHIVLWDVYPSHLISLMPGAWADNCPGTRRWLMGPGLFVSAARRLAGAVVPFLDAHSAALGVLKSYSHIRQLSVEANAVVSKKDCYFTKEAVLYDRALGATSYGNAELDRRLKSDLDAAYRVAAESLHAARKLVAERDVTLFFVLLPSKGQLTLSEGKPRPNQDSRLPNKRFAELIRDAGFEENSVIDLTDLFLDRARSQWFFEHDAHWTPEGHRVVAGYILKRIQATTGQFPS